jgi:quercetin dioxygenase-like cupin family protein
VTVKPGTAVHIPAGVKHGFTVTKGPVVAIQSYGPAGPEQRFKQPPPAAPVGGAAK